MKNNKLDEKTKRIRKIVLETCYWGNDGNIQSIFSSIDLIWVLYEKILRIDTNYLNNPDRDYFILSKGQATLGLVVILSEKNIIPKEELKTFCRFNSRISMQADRTKLPGIEVSVGSLGHGLPMAVGISWANKINNRNSHVYVLAGDGEMNQGTMWESLLFAASENIKNFTLIIDDNGSIKSMINFGNLRQKLESFGFHVIEINGHDMSEIELSLKYRCDKPICIIAQTIRGYGSKTLMEDKSWFHRAPNINELTMLVKEVNEF